MLRRPDQPRLKLDNGARVAVIGGGPAGSFFGYFLLQMAERVGLDVEIDLYEPREYTCPGPKGCNMCGGIVSESLMQNLATEGIHLPAGVIQRRIDSYFLHMDVGSVRIATPLQEMRIAAVARGAGPRGSPEAQESFDAFLLDLAMRRGVRLLRERVKEVDVVDGRPRIKTGTGVEATYDLLVSAVGVNSSILKNLEGIGSYRPPRLTKAYVAEFRLGTASIKRYLANAMHVFLLNVPRLEFAALIPKSDFVTVCLLGEQIDRPLVDAFLSSKEVAEVLPPHWQVPKDYCHCSPKLNVESAAQPFADRIVFVGDCGTTRLFKDGIGAAYRTAKAAARTAVFQGVAASDFQRGFWPTCRSIHTDNRLGKVVFSFTRQLQKRRSARRALWRLTSAEQKLRGDKRRMSRVLWDTFTGSATYKSVLMRSLHPGLLSRLGWELAAGVRSGDTIRPRERFALATGETGLKGRVCSKGKVIYEQGERSDSMYVVHGAQVELLRLEDDREVRLDVLADGDFFGEMALFGEATRPATARVLEDGYLFVLEREDLLRRVHEDPAMAFRLIENMAHRIAELEDRLTRGGGPGAARPPAPRLDEMSSWLGEPLARASEESGLMGKAYAKGEVIFHQGDRGDCMYVIQGGRVEIVRRDGDHECCVAVLEEGDFFGEMALFHGEIRPATARALGSVHVFTLEREGLLRRFQEDPSLAMQLLANMAQRIVGLENSIVRRPSSEAS